MQIHSIINAILSFSSIMMMMMMTTTHLNGVSAQQKAIRMTFTAPGSCTDDEYRTVTNCLYTNWYRRNLRTMGSTSNSTTTLSRELTTRKYPDKCVSLCAGMERGRCVTSKDVGDECTGYRHSRKLNTERKMQQSCTNLESAAHTCLDGLRATSYTGISSTCKSMIGARSTRQTGCFDRLSSGSVTGVRVWNITNTNSNSVIIDDMPTTGFRMCMHKVFNLESINDPCVHEAIMTLTNQQGVVVHNRIEYYQPYSLFGDNNGLMFGKQIRTPGMYTFTIVPDKDQTRKKTFTFELFDNCAFG